MSLSGRYWPYHPKPLPDELFSSWLARIARGNTAKVHTFCNFNWPGTQIWTRDIDKHGFEPLLDTLVEKCGVSYNAARSTTLEAYTGTIFERLCWKTHTKWVMPVGVYHRTRRRQGLQWCPLCLAEDKIPYFRKRWRMAFASCCGRHGVLLADKCSYCGTPASAHRATSLSSCSSCGANLADTQSTPAASRAIQLEAQMLSYIATGAAPLGHYGFVHSVVFFDILYRLMGLLAYGKRADGLRRKIADQYGGSPESVASTGASRLVEYLSPADRNRILDLIEPILPGWPFRFVGVCLESKNWSSWVLRDMKPTRFPLWEPSKTYLSGPTRAR